LWYELQRHPCRRLREYTEIFATDWGVIVSPKMVSRVFSSWGVSYKQVYYKQTGKYTQANIDYYADYTVAVRFIPLRRLKYMDEASFMSIGMPHVIWFGSCTLALYKKRGWALRGRRVFTMDDAPLAQTLSVTLMTTLDQVRFQSSCADALLLNQSRC